MIEPMIQQVEDQKSQLDQKQIINEAKNMISQIGNISDFNFAEGYNLTNVTVSLFYKINLFF
jgi:hypothetical protein